MDVTPERPWTPKAVASALAMQEACLAPGRAARIATGLNASAKLVDTLLAALEFETDPAAYALASGRTRFPARQRIWWCIPKSTAPILAANDNHFCTGEVR